MFNLNERYTFTTPDEPTPELVLAVNDFLAAATLPAPGLLTELFDWRWNVDKGEYRGKLPKRISQWLHKVHGIKVSDDLMAKLGNIAKPHYHKGETYHFDFVDKFDWKSGDFGDSGSCFWGSNAEARPIMQGGGVVAIRFYETSDSERGIARAWIAKQEEIYIVFNGYCRGGLRLETMDIAKIFAAFVEMNYKQITLNNHGRTNGTVWINSGKGYAIYPDSIKPDTWYDLELGFDGDVCTDCGCELSEYESYTAPNGDEYCESCFFEIYSYCQRCDETFYRDDLNYVEDFGDVCEHCLEHHFTRCDRCEEYHRNRDVIAVKEEHICRDCANA